MFTKRLACALVLFMATTAYAQLRAPANQLLIPAAGNVEGAYGTHFRSDVTLTNFRNADQRVKLQWLPQTATAVTPPPTPAIIVIPAMSGIASEDFVTNYLHQTGLGAILVTGVTSGEVFDSGALLFATARIWTPQPGSAGTVSQSFPVVPVEPVTTTAPLFIFGQRIDERYRTNVGIVNLETAYSMTFDIVQSTDNQTFAPVKTTIVVPPMSMLQPRLPDDPSHALQITITPHEPPVPAPGFTNTWVAYGSSLDNITGDSWSSLALPLLK